MKPVAVFVIILLICLHFNHSLFAQDKNILVKGFVTERSTREGIPGVTISMISPNKVLTNTNQKGAFSVYVPIGTVLRFNCVGFKPATEKVKSDEELNIRLEEENSALNEVVVRGYEKKTRELSPGSSVVVSGRDLQDVPVSNAEQLLQGKVPGLNIQVNTGAPGFRGTVLLRGISNIEVTGTGADAFLTATSPLYVIDGVPTDVDPATADGFNNQGGASPLSLIPQEDIASIEVLKDAQATSLYGSRGAFGVILITTRRGNSPIPRVRYTTNFFANTPPKLRETLGGKTERDNKMAQILKYGTLDDIYRRLGGTEGNYLTDSLNAYFNNSTNWQEVFYAPTFNQTHNIGVEGGNQKFNYKTNFGYYEENGIIKNTGVSRYNLGANMEYKPNDKLGIFAQITGGVLSRAKGNGIGLLNAGVATSSEASTLLPPPSLYLATTDVLAALQVRNSNPTKNLRTNFTVTFKPILGFSASTTGSYDISNSVNDTFTPAAANNQFARVETFNDSRTNLYNRNNISYQTNLGKSHGFSISVFNEMYITAYQSYASRQSNLPSDTYLGPVGFNGTFETSKGGGLLSYSRKRGVSFAGNFAYNFDKKYVFEFSYRMDATSSSGIEDPYTKSPAAGFRWNFNRENFLKDLTWLDYGSLRATWGKSTTPTGDVFSVYGSYEPKGTYNGNPRIGLNYNTLPNTAIGTAIGTTYNLGLDFGLFKNSLSVTFDTYYRLMDKQVRALELPNIIGFTNVISNEVSLRNYGYELSVSTSPLSRTSKVSWSLGANAAINKDVLTKLPGGVSQIVNGSAVFHIGRNALSHYLYENKGVYSTINNVPTDPATGLPLRNSSGTGAFFGAGDPMFTDVNGDYIINIDDRKVLGNAQPLITGGLFTNIGYKNFNVSINGSFTLKRDLINAAIASRLALMGNPFSQKVLLPIDGLNYWTAPGDVARYPDPFNYTRSGTIAPFRVDQSLFLESGSYFKINAVTLAYTFNKTLVSRLGLNSLRVYASGNNVITFSRYSGPNPENVSSYGYDNSGGYPLARTYNIGLNVEL